MRSAARWVPLVVALGWLFIAVAVARSEALAHLYTVEWVGRRIPVLIAPWALVVAWFGGWHGVAAGALGHVLGLALGTLIGDPVLARQQEQLRLQRLDPAYVQDWEPSHPGWWIALLTFFTVALIGMLMGLCRARGSGGTAQMR